MREAEAEAGDAVAHSETGDVFTEYLSAPEASRRVSPGRSGETSTRAPANSGAVVA
ncbi:hypothetical protein [Streptomyces sp. enrichment culture]|uniref:hypothetical protein n=1 Tax=Streptomyces sp. enrichment culture TaxID=1795815 RepID=UPI003F55147E